MPEEMRMMPDPASPTGYSLKPVYRPPTPLEIARGTLNNYADILGSYLTQQTAPRPSQFGRILQGMGYGQTPETVQAQQQRIQNLPLPLENRVRNAITQGVDYAGNFLAQGRAPEIGGAVRSMVEPVAQFPVTAVTDPLRAANQAQQALDPAYAMARGLTTTRLAAQEGNLGDVAAGVTEMGLAGLSFVPGGAAVKGARSMPPAPVRRPPPIGQPNVLAPPASRGPILNQLADQPELLGGGLGGALGATQGETPEERARNALLGAAGGAVGGRMARGMTPDKTRMGSNLGNVPKPVQKAQAAGYEGADIGEAKEWVAARSKGLDMSQAARLKRAEELGFDTRYKLFHATHSNFDAFDTEKIRTDLQLGEDAIFLTNSPAVADSYLGGAFVQRDAPKIIEKNVQGVDMGGNVGRYYSKDAAVYPLYAKNLNEYEVWDMGGGNYDPVFMQRAIKEAKENGAPGIILRGVRDPGIMDSIGPQGNPRTPATVVAVFNPKDVRSVNAAFDPASKGSANILAGVGAVGAGAAMTSQNKAEAQVGNPRRPDGTLKGKGWLGELPVTFPNGSTGVATEYSMQSDAVKVNGKNIDFPTLVPSLTPDEVNLMITDIIPNRKPIPEAIVQKAIAHARAQLAKGQSVFVENGPPDQKKPPGQRPRG